MALAIPEPAKDAKVRASSLYSYQSDRFRSTWEDDDAREESPTLSEMEAQRKRPDSYNLPGTVFLISSDGSVLNLPIPSENIHDPLNWSLKKRLLALFAIALFAFAGGVSVEAANTSIIGITLEFLTQVRVFNTSSTTTFNWS